LPFLTALVVLVTAIVGLYAARTKQQRDELDETSSSLEAETTRLESENEQLSATATSLEAENEELARQLDDNVEAETPATTTAREAGDDPGVFRETSGTPLLLGAGSGADIDSQASNWGVDGPGEDFGVSSSGNSISGRSFGDVKFSLVDAPPTFAECEAQTVSQTFVEIAETVVGQKMCVLTTEGRRAYVHIAAMDPEAETISFDVVVWKLPTDP
jgi:hypothetical protein